MPETARQTPYEFAAAFFSFLEARGVTNGDCSSHPRRDLRIPVQRAVTTGERRWVSCGLSADRPPTRHRCVRCGQPIPNGEALIRSRLFVQVAWCRPCLEASELTA